MNDMTYSEYLEKYGVPCDACQELTVEPFQLLGEVDRVVICDRCAEWVANHWYQRHGGQWLTWPNPPAPKPKKVTISRALRTKVFERDAYRCKHCGGYKDLRADHIVPESKGGETTFENLQTLCQSCNSRKGTRLP